MFRTVCFAALALCAVSALAEIPAPPAPPNQPPEVRRDAQLVPASASELSSTEHAAQRALLQQKLSELDRLQNEIGELRRTTQTPQQILIKFQVLEIARTKMRNMGMDFATLETVAVDGAGRPYTAPNSSDIDLQVLGQNSSLPGFLEALKKNRLARVLADPNLVVVSGRPASFHVGGEIPVPTAPGSKTPIEFLKFGTEVDTLAIAQGADQVRLELRMRVSEPDYGHTMLVEGRRIPVISASQIDTAATVAFGQSAVLGGMVQQRTEARETEAGRTEERVETELVFIATPERVDIGTVEPAGGGILPAPRPAIVK